MLRQKPYAQQPEVTNDMQKRSYENTAVELGPAHLTLTLSNFDKKIYAFIFFLNERGRKFESL